MLTLQNRPNLAKQVQNYADKHHISVEDFLVEAVVKLLAEKEITPNSSLVDMMENIEYTTDKLTLDETKGYLSRLKSK